MDTKELLEPLGSMLSLFAFLLDRGVMICNGVGGTLSG